MSYYDSSSVMNLLKLAYQGDAQAVKQIIDIAVPYAAAPDYSTLIVVQHKYASYPNEGLVKMLNRAAEIGEHTKQAADMYQCGDNGASWHSIPIPASFEVNKVTYQNGLFGFLSVDHSVVEGTFMQINRSMFKVSYAVNGVKESDIEACFHAIPSTVVEPPPRKQTLLDNPPISNKLIGPFAFDENLQQFKADYEHYGHSIQLSIATAYREQAAELLVQTTDIISRLTEVDQQARNYAANQLLDLKNDVWLDEDEEELSADAFTTCMSIDSISFEEDGSFQIWYADGDLFWGHSITVSCNQAGQPQDANING
jgi:hypothetical protein